MRKWCRNRPYINFPCIHKYVFDDSNNDSDLTYLVDDRWQCYERFLEWFVLKYFRVRWMYWLTKQEKGLPDNPTCVNGTHFMTHISLGQINTYRTYSISIIGR